MWAPCIVISYCCSVLWRLIAYFLNSLWWWCYALFTKASLWGISMLRIGMLWRWGSLNSSCPFWLLHMPIHRSNCFPDSLSLLIKQETSWCIVIIRAMAPNRNTSNGLKSLQLVNAIEPIFTKSLYKDSWYSFLRINLELQSLSQPHEWMNTGFRRNLRTSKFGLKENKSCWPSLLDGLSNDKIWKFFNLLEHATLGRIEG